MQKPGQKQAQRRGQKPRRRARRPIYVALTTLNDEMCGWTVIAYGHNRRTVHRRAAAWIESCGMYQDIYDGNYRIVSATVAQRKYHVRYYQFGDEERVGRVVWHAGS